MQQANVTVILNVFKRNYILEQLDAIYQQSIKPAEIWLVQMSDHVQVDEILRYYTEIKHIRSFVDIKYFGRFALAKFVTTKYTLIIDDDIIPSPSWLSLCINKCEKFDSIICSNGRLIPNGDYRPEVPKTPDYFKKYFIGDAIDTSFNARSDDTFVDYPCSSYFFKSHWLDYFWAVKPYTLEIGEDIHLAASCKLLGNVRTLVPAQKTKEESGNIKPEYSIDSFASWRREDFVEKRRLVIENLILEKKWRPILWQ
jgi:hypothetical protein